MTKATKALIPGAGEGAPYLLGVMNGSIRADDDALKGVEIAKKAMQDQYGTSDTTQSTGMPDGLSDEEQNAFSSY
jgi:hypothetical protein